MEIDIQELEQKLQGLKGLDFEECEKEEKSAGNMSVDISFSKSFQARLAARALGVNVWEIKELPLKKYSEVVMAVMNFLFAPSDKETPAEK